MKIKLKQITEQRIIRQRAIGLNVRINENKEMKGFRVLFQEERQAPGM